MYGTEFSRKPPKRKVKMSDAKFLILAIALGFIFVGVSYTIVTTSIVSPILILIGIILTLLSQLNINGNK
jgi:hypothetical protein